MSRACFVCDGVAPDEHAEHYTLSTPRMAVIVCSIECLRTLCDWIEDRATFDAHVGAILEPSRPS